MRRIASRCAARRPPRQCRWSSSGVGRVMSGWDDMLTLSSSDWIRILEKDLLNNEGISCAFQVVHRPKPHVVVCNTVMQQGDCGADGLWRARSEGSSMGKWEPLSTQHAVVRGCADSGSLYAFVSSLMRQRESRAPVRMPKERPAHVGPYVELYVIREGSSKSSAVPLLDTHKWSSERVPPNPDDLDHVIHSIVHE